MHEVEKMGFAGATPWHGLGTQIDGQTGFWEAFKQALSNPQPKSKQQPTSSGITTDYVLAKDK